jgi:hypothetical protein
LAHKHGKLGFNPWDMGLEIHIIGVHTLINLMKWLSKYGLEERALIIMINF